MRPLAPLIALALIAPALCACGVKGDPVAPTPPAAQGAPGDAAPEPDAHP